MSMLAASRREVLEQQVAAAEETGRCTVEVPVCELRWLLETQATVARMIAYLRSAL